MQGKFVDMTNIFSVTTAVGPKMRNWDWTYIGENVVVKEKKSLYPCYNPEIIISMKN